MARLRIACFAAVCVLLLAAYRYPTFLPNVETARSPSFEFVDARPAEQLKSGFESLLVSNCAYGSTRVGARDMTPDPAILVRDTLAGRLNDRLSGRKLTLRNLTLHQNHSAFSRQLVAAHNTGLIPGLLNKVEVRGCAPDDLRGGFAEGEVPKESLPVILVIDVDVGVQPVHVRCVSPYGLITPPLKMHPADFHAKWKAATDEVFRCALDLLVSKVGDATGALSAPSPAAASAGNGGLPK